MSADDDEFWQSLQGLTSRMDPVPGQVLTVAKESLAWRDTDTALASLVSQVGEPAGVRADHEPELLTFATGEVTIEVEVTVDGGTVGLIGQLVPPQPARIRVDHAGGPTWTEADELGRFAVGRLARGHLRLTCWPREAEPVKTVWTLI